MEQYLNVISVVLVAYTTVKSAVKHLWISLLLTLISAKEMMIVWKLFLPIKANKPKGKKGKPRFHVRIVISNAQVWRI